MARLRVSPFGNTLEEVIFEAGRILASCSKGVPFGELRNKTFGLPAYETLISYLTEVPFRGILGQGGAANSEFASPLLQYLDQSSS